MRSATASESHRNVDASSTIGIGSTRHGRLSTPALRSVGSDRQIVDEMPGTLGRQQPIGTRLTLRQRRRSSRRRGEVRRRVERLAGRTG